jgi:hypothetical protein
VTKAADGISKGGKGWDPTRFVAVCQSAEGARDEQLLTFCGKVMDREVLVLLDHCYSQLGT